MGAWADDMALLTVPSRPETPHSITGAGPRHHAGNARVETGGAILEQGGAPAGGADGSPQVAHARD